MPRDNAEYDAPGPDDETRLLNYLRMEWERLQTPESKKAYNDFREGYYARAKA